MEDAACSAGATYRGRPTGSLADAACFSFHGRKGITAGEGGAITSDNAQLMAKARKLHFFGVESAFARAGSNDLPVPVFDELGWNYKMSELAAAVVSVQLDRLPTLVKERRRVAAGYAELLNVYIGGGPVNPQQYANSVRALNTVLAGIPDPKVTLLVADPQTARDLRRDLASVEGKTVTVLDAPISR